MEFGFEQIEEDLDSFEKVRIQKYSSCFRIYHAFL